MFFLTLLLVKEAALYVRNLVFRRSWCVFILVFTTIKYQCTVKENADTPRRSGKASYFVLTAQHGRYNVVLMCELSIWLHVEVFVDRFVWEWCSIHKDMKLAPRSFVNTVNRKSAVVVSARLCLSLHSYFAVFDFCAGLFNIICTVSTFLIHSNIA